MPAYVYELAVFGSVLAFAVITAFVLQILVHKPEELPGGDGRQPAMEFLPAYAETDVPLPQYEEPPAYVFVVHLVNDAACVTPMPQPPAASDAAAASKADDAIVAGLPHVCSAA
ncbi:hypothetical protein HK105_202703 [Polyrhizophydium stewartii]|uniref:Uncharacterized protein n=1 Tax=Polyrhizophydium stewartii TaxID=2732419 RepID=A0ABR4NE81_9FUNG|nr:hypothetical protein HK105_005094 [Polyrhizophydium stewartii]